MFTNSSDNSSEFDSISIRTNLTWLEHHFGQLLSQLLALAELNRRLAGNVSEEPPALFKDMSIDNMLQYTGILRDQAEYLQRGFSQEILALSSSLFGDVTAVPNLGEEVPNNCSTIKSSGRY